jgi:SPP1 gp7 family putative phage head morphogenesis protein
MPTMSGDSVGDSERQSIEREWAQRLKEFLDAQAFRILEEPGPPPDAFWDEEETAMAALLLYLLLGAVERSIAHQVVHVMTPAGLGISDAVNARAGAWAEKHALKLAKGLTKTSKEQATRRITAWFAEGSGDMNRLRQSLGQIISPQWRADMIAQTEVTRAWSEGLHQVANEYDEIIGYEWFTQQDERVCIVCAPLHEKRRKKGEFYPGGYYAPPAHPRCRCGENLLVLK